MLRDEKTLVIDFGMSLRIPYSSSGRHLFAPRHRCGKLPHVAPEVYICRPFDGHAIDIWAGRTVGLTEIVQDVVDLSLTLQSDPFSNHALSWNHSPVHANRNKIRIPTSIR